jgi:hypothetical protein
MRSPPDDLPAKSEQKALFAWPDTMASDPMTRGAGREWDCGPFLHLLGGRLGERQAVAVRI